MSSRMNNGINVTGGNTSQQVQEDITSPAVDGNSRKRVRGPTYMPRIWAREEEDRIRVSFNEHGQPVDKETTSALSHFMGSLARSGKYCSVDTLWHKVENDKKENLLNVVNAKFDLPPGSDVWLLESFGKKLKLGAVNPDDLGHVDSISVEEIGGARVTVVRNEEGGNSVTTVVLRASTDSILDDLERAVDDGVNTYKASCKDSRIVPGAAATEIELAKRLKEFSFTETGLDQYAIAKFAESFEMIPKTLAENAGLNAMEIISTLYADHASGNVKVGIDLEEGACKDVSTLNIWDLYITKFHALKYAADAVCTVLRVDQIIMSKPAGGPGKRDQPAMDED